MKKELSDFFAKPVQLVKKERYWKYLDAAFEDYLEQYLQDFDVFRATDISELEWINLPFGNTTNNKRWSFRRESLKIVLRDIKKNKPSQILEIGAWNGWLTKFMAPECDQVLAVDYFSHPYDGIGAIRKFHEHIFPIQANLNTLKDDFNQGCFDMILLNHNLAFVENPTQYLFDLIPLLKDKGKILSIGNTYCKNPARIIKENEKKVSNFKVLFNKELYIQPLKGYFDSNDLNLLKAKNFKLKMYPSKFLRNIYARFNPIAPKYFYIEFQK